MMPAARVTPGLVIVVAAIAASGVLAARSDDGFPHAEHSRLFPICIGCHEGISSGDPQTYYPAPEECVSCHDGERVERVTWTGPGLRSSNMHFSHTSHAAALATEEMAELACGDCHTPEGGDRMDVEAPLVARCMSCHEHRASDHFVDADCRVCHRPLVESTFTGARIAALAAPATHATDDFLAERHGRLATAGTETCATCHAREQCAGCHVAAAAVPSIEEIGASVGRVAVPPIEARYPVPSTHRDANWERVHGQHASRLECGTCHTRENCTSCHLSQPPRAVLELAGAAESAAPGVRMLRRMPASHDSRFFELTHGNVAAERPQSCAACHEVGRFCAQCHTPGTLATTGPRAADATALHLVAGRLAPADTPPEPPRAPRVTRPRRAFHPADWVLRHSAQAWGRRLDCTTCHSTQLFCRDCHAKVGLGVAGNVGRGYHDAEPIWLLRHGQAGRQTLESCTACHTQRDCMQCHSQLGAFRVSPHGPGFDARAAHRANPQVCSACHLGDPLARAGPR